MSVLDDIQKVERELDALYHSVGFPRDDFDNGVARGLALALMHLRHSTVAHELKRSLNRLETLQLYGQAPWQQPSKSG